MKKTTKNLIIKPDKKVEALQDELFTLLDEMSKEQWLNFIWDYIGESELGDLLHDSILNLGAMKETALIKDMIKLAESHLGLKVIKKNNK